MNYDTQAIGRAMLEEQSLSNLRIFLKAWRKRHPEDDPEASDFAAAVEKLISQKEREREDALNRPVFTGKKENHPEWHFHWN